MAKLSSYIKSGSLAPSVVSGFSTVPPLIVGGTTVTGTSSQNLQVIGGGYFSNSVGIGTTNPRFSLEVGAVGASGTSLYVNGDARVTGILSVGQGTITINGNTDKITAPKFEYAGISSTITATATDVFVYDTRKDSDGGAWRKRTQNTSWYNETLNTATRGSRRDFPAVAVIVRESGYLKIYDGDDPDLPMWMIFEANNNTLSPYILEYFTTGGTSVTALNGIIVSGHNSNGATTINFINEKSIRYRITESSGTYDILGSISQRNTFLPVNFAPYSNTIGLVNSAVNDVAMTVLPNAPIDSTTGLPVPTIAVATAGGANVIKDDGTVANIGGTVTTKIDINQNLIFTASTANGGYYGFTVDGFSSINAFFNTVGNLRILSNVNSNTNNNLIVPNSSNLYCGQTVGLSLVYKNGLSNDNYDGMVAYATTTYNTGWMHGDIKGAFLSDTSTASVTGTELNQYGDFASTTGWGSRSAAWTISGGVASVSSGAGYQLLGLTSGTLTNGRKYAVTVNVTAFTAGRLELSQTNSSNIQFNLSSTGLKSLIFTYTGTSGQALGIYGYGDASYAFTIDDLYVRELSEADRSVNNTGLAVYGTVTKSAVATGADLVGYSGFSDGDYLKQPHNSSLEFGTGNYSIIFWINSPSIAIDQSIFTLGDYNQSNSLQLLVLNSSGNGNSLSYSEVGSSVSFLFGPHEGNGWIQIAIVRNGITVSAYINGILKTTVSNANPTNINLSSATHKNLVIGAGSHSGTIGYSYSGSISLFRISATAPSPDQITKIYNDEKALFQENSKATLYGNSSAVTALAYDDSTRLLYAGTSSGRSEFQGLRRINNTTTAVTTAISASNGLIAEQ